MMTVDFIKNDIVNFSLRSLCVLPSGIQQIKCVQFALSGVRLMDIPNRRASKVKFALHYDFHMERIMVSYFKDITFKSTSFQLSNY